jgi:26S proteasome regulatory subunit N3
MKEATKAAKEMAEDVEMKDVSEAPAEDQKKDADSLTQDDIRQHVRHIEKAVSTKEPRFMSRALRALATLRKRLNSNVLRKSLSYHFPPPTANTGAIVAKASPNSNLLEFLEAAMDSSDNTNTPPSGSSKQRPNKLSQSPPSAEVEIYLHLLFVIYLLDQQKNKSAQECANLLMDKITSLNRRTLDMLAAKCYFYYARTYELTNQLDQIRHVLHARLRTCTLRSDHEGQAALLNLLLRNYLSFNLYDQADKLVTKSTFPENASNNEWARYLYYLGRIKAIQLDYSEAHLKLLLAMRKAPQHTAVGFKQTVQKFAITVELLLGDIPDKAVFRQPSLRKTLQPYFQLTQAVRTGNLAAFNETVDKYGKRFEAEGTYTLIVRLRHNVIKTGVRMISLSYSRISLDNIAAKLVLDSPEDTEFIVAKAIRDGVIEATIDHEHAFVQSKENMDIYSTREPMTAFHQRITFCLDIHNQSVKAMRFPPKSYNKDLESAEERREREAQELESAKEIAEDEYDEFG